MCHTSAFALFLGVIDHIQLVFEFIAKRLVGLRFMPGQIEHHRGGDYFPDYGLDPDANYKPVKALADVIRVLKDGKDGWGMAFWFAAVNSYLGGKAPKDLLATAPDKVIAAAHEEMSETAHG